jgi:tetratricopeptide (TPR) repeat protein
LPVDRDSTLKNAEKLLRMGRLDGAIEEYVRLVEDQPRDWNSINALGDLYVRAGQVDKAVVQFTKIADHLFADGVLAKAAALYKKALKSKADDEHLLLRLSETTARQGLFADARIYLRQLEKLRRGRQDVHGALDCVVRVGLLEDADAEAKIAAARASEDLLETEQAARLFRAAADDYQKASRDNDALNALIEAARLEPNDVELRAHLARTCMMLGQVDLARQFVTREIAGDDPDLLLTLARNELQDGHDREARITVTRLLTVAPGHVQQVADLALETAATGAVEAAYSFVETVIDDAMLMEDWAAAIAVLQRFASGTAHVPALLRLVEVSIDAGSDDAMRAAQLQLTDAYLAAGRAAEARVIAEDLAAFRPSEDHLARLRSALELLGVDDRDAIVAGFMNRQPEEPLDDLDFGGLDSPTEDLNLAVTMEPVTEVTAAPEPAAAAPLESPVPPASSGLDDELDADSLDASDGERIVLETLEVDLSDALGTLGAPAPPPSLDDVFARMRDDAARGSEVNAAQASYDRGVALLDEGRTAEAVGELQTAARAPALRFAAAARLGRILLGAGDTAKAIEWLERAAEAPAPSAEDGYAVLYDMAVALQGTGETARALAILMELEVETAGYRDVGARVRELRSIEASERSA